jgi:hypothetical protein
MMRFKYGMMGRQRLNRRWFAHVSKRLYLKYIMKKHYEHAVKR